MRPQRRDRGLPRTHTSPESEGVIRHKHITQRTAETRARSRVKTPPGTPDGVAPLSIISWIVGDDRCRRRERFLLTNKKDLSSAHGGFAIATYDIAVFTRCSPDDKRNFF